MATFFRVDFLFVSTIDFATFFGNFSNAKALHFLSFSCLLKPPKKPLKTYLKTLQKVWNQLFATFAKTAAWPIPAIKKRTTTTMRNIELPSPETIKTAQVEPLLYDINQTAALLNCCTKSVRRLIMREELKSCNALRKVLIPRKQIEDFIRRTCGTPKPLI
jgi:hypothetical protein